MSSSLSEVAAKKIHNTVNTTLTVRQMRQGNTYSVTMAVELPELIRGETY